jgi:uncharacterized membrane protein
MLVPGYRNAQIAANAGRWRGLYTLASIVGFALIVWGWALYRPESPELYAPPDWARYVAAPLVLLAFIFLVAAYAPTGRIKATLKHPFLAAVMLWAVAHLIANGDLASVLVFGSFLAFAVINRIAVSLRPDPEPKFVSYWGDVIAVVAGTAATALFVFWLHAFLFGVSPVA